MSIRQITKAFDAKVGNPLRKLILIKLADNANDEGYCWPSYATIAEMCEVSERTAMRHINELIKQGFLSKNLRVGKNGNTSNMYCLTLDSGVTESHKGVTESHKGGCHSVIGGVSHVSPEPSLEPSLETSYKNHVSSDDDQLVQQKDQNQKHNCPHELILDAWKRVMPEKTQHNRSTWQGSVGAANLAARWKECFKIKREAGARKGQLLYETYEEGIKWWEQFFTFLRNSNFLMGNTEPMPGHKRFALTLKWVVKKENFINILEYKYHDKPSERAPVAPQPEFRNGI